MHYQDASKVECIIHFVISFENLEILMLFTVVSTVIQILLQPPGEMYERVALLPMLHNQPTHAERSS